MRFPFKTVSNGVAKACCNFDNGDFGTRTYNPAVNECCDGEVRPTGSAC